MKDKLSPPSYNLLKKISSRYQTPIYLYDVREIRQNILNIKKNLNYKPLNIHYAMMANSNPAILKEIKKLNINVFVSSITELKLAYKSGFRANQIIANMVNISESDVKELIKHKPIIVANSEFQLRCLARLSKRKEVALRINFSQNKFDNIGFDLAEVNTISELTKEMGLKIIGLQTYVGTNKLYVGSHITALENLAMQTQFFPDIKFIDIGGGFSIQNSEGISYDWESLGRFIKKNETFLLNKSGRSIELKIEPGRAIIGNAGFLVFKVVEIVNKKSYKVIGVDTGFSNFPRSYIYNEFHPIITIKNRKYPNKENVIIKGNTILQNDYLSSIIKLPKLKIGDLLVLNNAGAYGYSMSSNFTGKLKPPEILLYGDNKYKVIRKREDINEIFS
jgi:diaminopimelate decarboxylase